MAFYALDSGWYKLNSNLMKRCTQLGQSSAGGWQVKALLDPVGAWLLGEVTRGGTV